jgi:hypothetical protein
MEYAVWMGKFSILGSLLVGGVNPCVRSGHKQNEDEDDNMPQQLSHIGSRVLKRFFDCFPLSLSSNIVKRVVDMRMGAYYAQQTRHHGQDDVTCPICRQEQLPLGIQLHFPTCQHTFCEPCFWEDLLNHIDDRGDVDDVVLCPICGIPGAESSGVVGTTVTSSNLRQLTPQGRCHESLTRFQSLPLDRQALKSKREKKKRLSEQEHLACSWNAAVVPSLGSTQDVRRDKLFPYIEKNAIHYVRGCLMAGVDVNWTNEYGQTALYICGWRGYAKVAELLLDFGANPSVLANGSSTLSSISAFHQHSALLELLEKYNRNDKTDCKNAHNLLTHNLRREHAKNTCLTTLISESTDHPGAGSYIVDEAISSDQVDCLLELFDSLPVETAKKKQSELCSERSYFCDAEGFVREMLEEAIQRVNLVSKPNAVKAFSNMRFLNYSKAGAVLPPHVDLCRVDPFSGHRSTHTFILYVTNCERGGETSLLGDVSGDGRSKIFACVAPKRGRLLIFPHACPHEGNEVNDVPKTLLRGEILLSK